VDVGVDTGGSGGEYGDRLGGGDDFTRRHLGVGSGHNG